MSTRTPWRLAVALAGLTAATVLGGCPAPTGVPSGARAPAVVARAERVETPGAPIAIYLYPETITAYPDDDRGAYVVRLGPGPEGDAARAELEALSGGDLVGDDGHVVRLSAAAQAALVGRPGVRAVSPLQPAERRPPAASSLAASATAASVAVRIDLFADASADEAAAVAAWITARGGVIGWRGPTALAAELPRAAIAAAARLSPVRWVE